MGSALLYWLVIKPISLLPYPLLYGLSDLFFVVVYYLLPYRKKVVDQNLRMALPALTDSERKEVSKKFYRHFCDVVVESLKNFSISAEDSQKRMRTVNPEVLNVFAEKGQSVILAGGHYNNWELWAVAASAPLQHKVLAIYKRLNNAYFDAKMRSTRSKFGLLLMSTKETSDYFKNYPNELNATVFAIDQSPADPKKSVWVTFMGLDTAAYFGAEKYAKELNRPVVYGVISKVRRGYYEMKYQLVVEHPQETLHGEITQRLHRFLEQEIYRAPEYWLWTHKRWKHRREAVKTD
jgi:KDO2-lipid IV(A) lauroyltransferase